MDDHLYEINIKRFIQSTEYQLKKLNECITRLNEVYFKSFFRVFDFFSKFLSWVQMKNSRETLQLKIENFGHKQNIVTEFNLYKS